MPEFLDNLSLTEMCVFVFLMRIVDVSLGTIRAVSVTQGRRLMAVCVGFLEVFFWIFVVAQILLRIGDLLVLSVAYAFGYAAGIATGMAIEKRLAIGTSVLRMISLNHTEAIVQLIRAHGYAVTTFKGEGRDGARTLMFIICNRHDINCIIKVAKEVDPHLFYLIEPVTRVSSSSTMGKVANWRILLEKS